MHSAPALDGRELTGDIVRTALSELSIPGVAAGRSLAEAVRQLSVCGGRVTVRLALEVSSASELADIEAVVSERLRTLGASDVELSIRRARGAAAGAAGIGRDPWADRVRLPGVGHVVAVGAGKGGVGKSTVAVNLALALAREGLRVGLLDADIYGPSVPILLGIADGTTRGRMTPDKRIVPIEAFGLPLVSFACFLGERSPAVWRGPIVSKAVRQFARGVVWPTLDVLLVDLPPGTGDVPLSLSQSIELTGAVVVTQPARLSIAEARKAVRMFAMLEVRVLGIVENMTGAFGTGAAEAVAAELEVPFLGEIPFDAEVVREGDRGTPAVFARTESPTAQRFDRIAQRLGESLGWRRVATEEGG